MATPWLVVGLGNPGPTYGFNRHNAGFLVVDEIARRAAAKWGAPRGLRAEAIETRLVPSGWGGVGAEAARVALMKPKSFMNDSGGAVAAVLRHVAGDAAHLIVVHDELDLDLGQLRVKLGGGDNGHNGLRSIRQHLGDGDYFRVRVGIGRPPSRQDPADYVLSNFAPKDRDEVALVVDKAADAVESLIAVGLDQTQSRFNS